MRTLVVVSVLCVVATQAARLRREETYNTQYDNVDLDEILNNQRLFDSYHKCLMDQGPCTQDGKTLREAVPDALTTGCSKCSDKQRDGARKVIKFLREKKPSVWDSLKKKHDPSGIYEKQYRKQLEQI